MEEHCKYAETSFEVERLRRQAAILDAARHPGVVELLRLDEEGKKVVLVTARVQGQPLATLASLTPEELAGLGAALATTLADLHEQGLVHGELSADHVIVRPDGTPVLCGFGSGGQFGELLPGRSSPLDPAIDIEGLARTLRHFAVGPRGRRLRDVARSAMDGAAGLDAARRLADDLRTAVADARLPTTPAADSGTSNEPLRWLLFYRADSRSSGTKVQVGASERSLDRVNQKPSRPTYGRARRVGARAVLVGAVGLVSALGLASWVGAGGDAIPDPPPAPFVPVFTAPPAIERSATTTTVTAGETPTPAGISPVGLAPRTASVEPRSLDCAEAVGILTADVDGDGCDEVLHFDGGELVAGSRKWQLGRVGDMVVTGDWSCRGHRTLALLRPVSGAVYVFDGWASANRDLAGDRLGRVDGARALRAGDVDGDGCHELVIERFDGTTEVLSVIPPAEPTR